MCSAQKLDKRHMQNAQRSRPTHRLQTIDEVRLVCAVCCMLCHCAIIILLVQFSLIFMSCTDAPSFTMAYNAAYVCVYLYQTTDDDTIALHIYL